MHVRMPVDAQQSMRGVLWGHAILASVTDCRAQSCCCPGHAGCWQELSNSWVEMSDDRCVLPDTFCLAIQEPCCIPRPLCKLGGSKKPSVPALLGLPRRPAALVARRPAEWTVYNDIHLNVPIPQWYRDFRRLNQDHNSSAWPPKPTLNSQQPAGAWVILQACCMRT